MKKAEEILDDLARLTELLDDEALKQVSDLPFVEIAKVVSVKRPKARAGNDHQGETREKTPPCSPVNSVKVSRSGEGEG